MLFDRLQVQWWFAMAHAALAGLVTLLSLASYRDASDEAGAADRALNRIHYESYFNRRDVSEADFQAATIKEQTAAERCHWRAVELMLSCVWFSAAVLALLAIQHTARRTMPPPLP